MKVAERYTLLRMMGEDSREREPITLETLRECGWEEASYEAASPLYAWADALSSVATRTEASDDSQRRAGLELLGMICRLGLEPRDRHRPFRPCLTMGDRRTFLPEDLRPAELLVVGEFAAHVVSHPLLAARLFDIAWTHCTPRHTALARSAIDNYVKACLQQEWHDAEPMWERAVTLARQTKDKDRLETIEHNLTELVRAQDYSAPLAARLLRASALGKSESVQIATILEGLGQKLSDERHYQAARESLLEAASWHSVNKSGAEASRAKSRAADAWVREGEALVALGAQGYLVAGAYYESAIHLLREVPHGHRADLDVDRRLAEFRGKLTSAHTQSLDVLQEVNSEPIDVSMLVEYARDTVAGREPLDALRAYCRMFPLQSERHALLQATAVIKKYPLQAMFQSVALSRDGRILSKTRGINPGSADSSDTQGAILCRALQDYKVNVALKTEGALLPALDVLQSEHRLGERDFVALSRRSPIVPRDREVTVGRGLHAGYIGDFAVAVHLLAPQLEHIVRVALSSAGVQTRQLAPQGVETEIGLSSLMEKAEAAQVFGDFAFELRATFCEGLGFNLRNEVAHGLLGDSDMESSGMVYGWYSCLRLILLPLLLRESEDPPSQT